MSSTAGQKRLKTWLSADKKSRSQAALARLLGVTQPAVSQWLRGVSRPEMPHRVAIEHLTGIHADEWLSKGETRALAGAIQRIDRSTGTDG